MGLLQVGKYPEPINRQLNGNHWTLLRGSAAETKEAAACLGISFKKESFRPTPTPPRRGAVFEGIVFRSPPGRGRGGFRGTLRVRSPGRGGKMSRHGCPHSQMRPKGSQQVGRVTLFTSGWRFKPSRPSCAQSNKPPTKAKCPRRTTDHSRAGFAFRSAWLRAAGKCVARFH